MLSSDREHGCFQKNWHSTLLVLLSTIILLISTCPSLNAAQISVMASQLNETHREALEAFLNSIDKSERPAIFTYDFGENTKTGREIAREIRNSDTDLVLAMGTKAALIAKEEIKNIPIVFCMVLNPVSSGLVKNLKSPGGNITGASLDIPIETQFKHMKLLVPNLKSIGVIYNPKETGPLILSATEVCKDMGLSLVAKPISAEREIPEALRNMQDKVDFLWSVADGTVFGMNSIRYILLQTLRTGMPFMGLSPSFVKAGALLALSCNYADIGKQAAQIADRITKGEKPGNIDVTVPRKFSLHINLRTANQIGVHVPNSVIRLADEVIK